MDTAPDTFRLVMGRFATGISVVTTLEGGDPGRPAGITVNALSSVSLDPPLVMVALDRSRFITPMVRAHGRYAVNILGDGQQALS
ncbi:MAG TPA: flavin reductase family protein, partial [Candidatus Limnocylindrales bacterium]|nr:flavin reductase family protein [Candidatus Limnocylindrales bacterium]